MISLKVIHSNNFDQVGEYKFGFNQIIFSNSSKSHLFTDFTIAVEIVKDKIYLISPNEKVLVNNKFSGELYSLKRNDKISYQGFEFEIIDYSFTSYPSIKESLNNNTNEIIKNHPKVHQALTQIREEMKDV